MDGVIRSGKEAYVKLDGSEARLIALALDNLRYSDITMTGSQLVDLAGLSMEWRGFTQDLHNRWSSEDELLRMASKVAGIEIMKQEVINA